MKLKTQLNMLLGLPFLCILTASSLIYYFYFISNLNDNIKNYLETASEVCLQNVDLSKMNTLYDLNRRDENQKLSYYIDTLTKLNNLKNIYHLAYIYTLIPSEQKYYFIFDTDNYNETDPNNITFLSEYKEPPEDFIKAVKSGVTVITDRPYTDEYGTFISIFVPLKNSKNTVTAVLGMDYNISFISAKKVHYSIIFCISFVITVLFSVVIISTFSSRFGKPVKRLSLKFTAIADSNGDLTNELPASAYEELTELSCSFNDFQKKLRNIITNIKDISRNLASAMEQVSATTISISDNIQQQTLMESEIIETTEKSSSMIEQVSFDTDIQCNISEILGSMINELSKSIKELSVEAETAMNMSKSITLQIREGEKSLQMLDTIMQNIEKSSKEMNNIVELINDISDQINLLSLNASIESARAGDAGRGFAVVAEEISKLADKTALNLKEINNLIKVNDSNIKDGMTSVKVTVRSINSMINDINNITSVINKMFSFMQKQAVYEEQTNKQTGTMKSLSEQIKKSIDEHRDLTIDIHRAVEEIGNMSRNNASAIEELAASTEEIAGMSIELDQMVNIFKT